MANCILLTKNEESQHTNNTYNIVIASDYLFAISNNYNKITIRHRRDAVISLLLPHYKHIHNMFIFFLHVW